MTSMSLIRVKKEVLDLYIEQTWNELKDGIYSIRMNNMDNERIRSILEDEIFQYMRGYLTYPSIEEKVKESLRNWLKRRVKVIDEENEK